MLQQCRWRPQQPPKAAVASKGRRWVDGLGALLGPEDLAALDGHMVRLLLELLRCFLNAVIDFASFGNGGKYRSIRIQAE